MIATPDSGSGWGSYFQMQIPSDQNASSRYLNFLIVVPIVLTLAMIAFSIFWSQSNPINATDKNPVETTTIAD